MRPSSPRMFVLLFAALLSCIAGCGDEQSSNSTQGSSDVTNDPKTPNARPTAVDAFVDSIASAPALTAGSRLVPSLDDLWSQSPRPLTGQLQNITIEEQRGEISRTDVTVEIAKVYLILELDGPHHATVRVPYWTGGAEGKELGLSAARQIAERFAGLSPRLAALVVSDAEGQDVLLDHALLFEGDGGAALDIDPETTPLGLTGAMSFQDASAALTRSVR